MANYCLGILQAGDFQGTLTDWTIDGPEKLQYTHCEEYSCLGFGSRPFSSLLLHQSHSTRAI